MKTLIIDKEFKHFQGLATMSIITGNTKDAWIEFHTLQGQSKNGK